MVVATNAISLNRGIWHETQSSFLYRDQIQERN
uniref:Uncharacterized protein n=1 Tax=Arundo donax TaxID=35708 RepID=A0A0A9G8L7_ARUDO